jgi:hypothetical protein
MRNDNRKLRHIIFLNRREVSARSSLPLYGILSLNE